ncbi:Yip1 family protein [Caulobacter sp. DWR2-3-1b2]|uniref:Yip1 family protein n=1 Tax=Caulobacter sp. DWR2-3-1b2 TaxID=2804642 RepID=UPI003CF30DF6
MSAAEHGAGSFNLFGRLANLLRSPSAEWDQIDQEPTRLGYLNLGYVGLVAAIPSAAKLVLIQLFGHGFLPLKPMIAGAAVQYALTLLSVFALALVINGVAPGFDGRRDFVRALKVAAYASTPGWLFGLLGVFPLLGIVGVLANLYGVYLYYVGLPRLMRSAKEKAFGYMAVATICWIVLFVGTSTATNLTAGWIAFHGDAFTGSTPKSILNDDKAAAEMFEAMQAQAATNANVAAARAPVKGLGALLPLDIAGYQRAGGESGWNETTGTSVGKGDYIRGALKFSLTITDLGPSSIMASVATAISNPSTRKTANGYETVEKLNGRLVTEKWDNTTNSGSYSMLVADRFTVEAAGQTADIDELRQAVNAVDAARLEVLSREPIEP